MIPGLQGRSVAVVGRAESLLAGTQGKWIDAAEVVVRVNWTLPLDPALQDQVGSRTDVLYHCLKLCEAQRLAALAHQVATVRIDAALRKEMARDAGHDPGIYQPNTGTVAVLDSLRSGARAVWVFGMDFFATAHVGAEIPAPTPKTWAWDHDPEVDRGILRDLMLSSRIIPDPVLAEALR